MQHRKDNKVRGLRAAYSIGAGDLIGTADAGQGRLVGAPHRRIQHSGEVEGLGVVVIRQDVDAFTLARHPHLGRQGKCAVRAVFELVELAFARGAALRAKGLLGVADHG